MRISGLSPVSPVFIPVVIITATIAFLVLTPDSTVQAGGNFAPTITNNYCNGLPTNFADTSLQGPDSLGAPGVADCFELTDAALAAIENTTPGAPQTVTTHLIIPTGDTNFSAIVTMAPNEVVFTPTCVGAQSPPGDTCLPVGEKVGGLKSLTRLGIGNAACTGGVNPEFVFYNVALPNDLADPRASTNIAKPQVEGTEDRFGRWAVGTGNDADIAEGAGTAVTQTVLPDIADGTNIAIENFPNYLLDLFDADKNPGGTDGSKKPIVPIAVYGSLTKVPPATGDWIPLYLVQFGAGDLSTGSDAFVYPSPLSQLDAGLGQPNVVVLVDPTIEKVSPGSITDFCSRLETLTMLLGVTAQNSAGCGNPNPDCVRATNPSPAGTYRSLSYLAGLRDLDNDTYENAFDTCPTVSNVDGDPRTTAGSDGDMIDSACDDTPDENTQGGPTQCPGQPTPQLQTQDHDGDCFQNAQDNCPKISNSSQAGTGLQGDLEITVAYSVAAPDGGPKGDGIGGSGTGGTCDTGSFDFAQNITGLTAADCEPPATPDPDCTSITLSATVANGHFHNLGIVGAQCFGLTDADFDGYCSGDDGDDSNPDRLGLLALAPPNPSSPGNDTSSDKFRDIDDDGYTTWQESFYGTDDTKACSANSTVLDEPLRAYPGDFNDNQVVNLDDVLFMAPPVFFSVAGDVNYTRAADLSANGVINLDDVLFLAPPIFFSVCAPVAQQ